MSFLGDDGVSTDLSGAKRVPLRVLFDSGQKAEPNAPVSQWPGPSRQQLLQERKDRLAEYDFEVPEEANQGKENRGGTFGGGPVYNPTQPPASVGDAQTFGQRLTFESSRTSGGFGARQLNGAFGGRSACDTNRPTASSGDEQVTLARRLTFESSRTSSNFGGNQQSGKFDSGAVAVYGYDTNRPPDRFDDQQGDATFGHGLPFEPSRTSGGFVANQQSGAFGGNPWSDQNRAPASFGGAFDEGFMHATNRMVNFGAKPQEGTVGGAPFPDKPYYTAMKFDEPGFQRVFRDRDMQKVDEARLVLKKGFRPIRGRKFDHPERYNNQSIYSDGSTFATADNGFAGEALSAFRQREPELEKSGLNSFDTESAPPSNQFGRDSLMQQDRSFSIAACRDNRPPPASPDGAGAFAGNVPLACGGYHGTKASAWRCLKVNVDEVEDVSPSSVRQGQVLELNLIGGCAGALNADGSFVLLFLSCFSSAFIRRGGRGKVAVKEKFFQWGGMHIRNELLSIPPPKGGSRRPSPCCRKMAHF